MANKTITLTIPSAKVATAVSGFLAIYPNREKMDEEPFDAKYTDNQWIVERIRRNIVRDIRRGLQKLAHEAAAVVTDDSIITS